MERDTHIAGLLDELAEYGRRHDAEKADRLERLRNLETETARMLSVLVQALAPAQVLELGTSNGYSTVWLAQAAHTYGGHLTSVEILPERTELARVNLERAGLSAVVELRVQDAGEALAASADREWALIFLDSERSAYVRYWPELVRALAPGGLLVVDNVLSHADELAEFRALLTGDDRFHDAVVPIGAGVLLAVRH